MGPRRSKRPPPTPEKSSTENTAEKVFLNKPTAPASLEDRQNWKGFCEIESDPAFFNVMLRTFGVQDVKVQEVFSLDEDALVEFSRPIYGLIFLFRWVEENLERQEQSCPDDVWFANQTMSGSCASVAMLNIVNNVPGLDLGDNLKEFKTFTQSFSPALRGDAISNFDFVKRIHNSFARKMDMLNIDLQLKNDAKSSSKKRKVGDDEDESAFHFIAFMPINGKLWKLDGLERQPMSLGQVKGDWVKQAKPDILARMAQYEESQIEFAILSLLKDPICTAISALAINVKSVVCLSTRLEELRQGGVSDDHDDAIPGSNSQIQLISGPDPSLRLTQKHIDSSEYPEKVVLVASGDSRPDIRALRRQLADEQLSLKIAVQREIESWQEDEDKANVRRRDLGGRMQKFAEKVKRKSGA